MKGSVALTAVFLWAADTATAQNVALLLFDATTSEEFAGCLNCSPYSSESVCNRYGEYGSRYSDTSIWNRYGSFGSRYQSNSPWNRYGGGLLVVDADGQFYGHFSLNKFPQYGQSKLPIIQAILQLYEADNDLGRIRDVLCR